MSGSRRVESQCGTDNSLVLAFARRLVAGPERIRHRSTPFDQPRLGNPSSKIDSLQPISLALDLIPSTR
jgi:hypothetical protein